MRPRTIFALCTLAGVAVSAWVYLEEQASVRAGENSAAVGFGTSHLLFFVSLPWSAGVLFLMWAAAAASGADGPAFLRPFFYAMPVAAGAGWGALAALIADWRAVRRRSRPAT
jgi:hypothetical protein